MKRGNHSKFRGSKALVMALAVILLVGASIGGTLGWFTDTTAPVVNTFTVGNIDITLTESVGLDFTMIPGHTIVKDPEVTVEDGSEDCWLFVKLEEAITPQTTDGSFAGPETFDSYISYTMADGWTELPGYPGVYYRSVMAADSVKTFSVLADDEVTVNDTVTKDMMGKLADSGSNPTLTVTAYACQYMKSSETSFTAVEAWTVLNTTP